MVCHFVRIWIPFLGLQQSENTASRLKNRDRHPDCEIEMMKAVSSTYRLNSSPDCVEAFGSHDGDFIEA